MEEIITDLNETNEKLAKELELTRGQQQTSEEEILAAKRQVEQEYKAKLAYKDTEIEGVNTKLGRISQTNIELKTRCERLEGTNEELVSELEQNRVRISSLEMELEMTKVNAENDSEKQVEQIRNELTG